MTKKRSLKEDWKNTIFKQQLDKVPEWFFHTYPERNLTLCLNYFLILGQRTLRKFLSKNFLLGSQMNWFQIFWSFLSQWEEFAKLLTFLLGKFEFSLWLFPSKKFNISEFMVNFYKRRGNISEFMVNFYRSRRDPSFCILWRHKSK